MCKTISMIALFSALTCVSCQPRLHITLEAAPQKQHARKKASAELNCNIVFVDRNYGFVRIDAGAKGDTKRVQKGSELTVLRADKKVCDLIVTQLTDTEAIAYVQDGTLGVGDIVKVGDKVVAKNRDYKTARTF